MLVISLRYKCGEQQEVLVGCGRGKLAAREREVVIGQILFSLFERTAVLLKKAKCQSQVNTDFTLISCWYMKPKQGHVCSVLL